MSYPDNINEGQYVRLSGSTTCTRKGCDQPAIHGHYFNGRLGCELCDEHHKRTPEEQAELAAEFPGTIHDPNYDPNDDEPTDDDFAQFSDDELLND